MSVTFTAQSLGETEKALNAILARELAGTGLSEHQWITLTLARMMGADAPVDGDELVARLAHSLRLGHAEATGLVTDLVSARLLTTADANGSAVSVTEAGRRLHDGIRTSTTRITEHLWGDLPSDDLDAAGRVLHTVLQRANAELANV
jgi:DNA-binding MarR family transcriptional regulator